MAPKPLRLLGLARNAGRLVYGLDAVKGVAGRASLLVTASDAGSSVTREAEHLSRICKIPLITLPYDKRTLGMAIGKPLCAVAAVTDKGLAGSVMESLRASCPAPGPRPGE